MTVPIVELRDVFCVHRTNEGDAAALQGTTLVVGQGEVVSVLGPSGAGKSTLLRVIAAIQPPSAGLVRVLGHDVGRATERVRATVRHQLVGFLGQRADAALAPDLRVAAAVALPLSLRGIAGGARRRRAAELLEAAGLGDRADSLPGELSGGERQRVALCAALAHRPELLLADEPTGELDADSAEAMRKLIVALVRSEGASAVIVSHDPATATVADRMVRIRDGRVAEDRVGGESALVVGRGGWVKLPEELLAQAGIGDRARVVAAGGRLIVSSALAAPETSAGTPTTSPVVDDFVAGGAQRVPSDGRAGPARLELRAVRRSLGRGRARRRVIDGLTLTVAPARLTVVSGRSGSGKTTLLRLLVGLDVPNAGEIVLDGRPLGGLDAERLAALRRERIGYLPQEPWPVGFLSAEENVVLALRLRGWAPGPAAERAAVALGRVGLADRAGQRVGRLSAGESQRVALARALASARGLLVVDEPTSRLDQSSAAAVAELLTAAAREERQTVICATHDLELTRRADELVTLS